MFNFTKYSKIYYIFSGILILASLASLIVFGLRFGIEFTGGSNMELEFLSNRPENSDIRQVLDEFHLGEVIVQPTSQNGAVLRFSGVNEQTHQEILTKLNDSFQVQEKSFEYIGPSIGQELKNKTIISVVLTLLAITLYIAFAFRKASYHIGSYKYGLASLVALFHDILIPLGVFALLGHFYNVEITIPIIAALLTILGFSVHDTIVIFDRIRENILRNSIQDFTQIVDISLNQTLGRSISTVLTTLVVIVFMYFFGGETLRYFSLALIIGITSGAYSSIFIAGPLLVSWKNFSDKKARSR